MGLVITGDMNVRKQGFLSKMNMLCVCAKEHALKQVKCWPYSFRRPLRTATSRAVMSWYILTIHICCTNLRLGVNYFLKETSGFFLYLKTLLNYYISLSHGQSIVPSRCSSPPMKIRVNRVSLDFSSDCHLVTLGQLFPMIRSNREDGDT